MELAMTFWLIAAFGMSFAMMIVGLVYQGFRR
jgi:hypothetical protein